MTAAPANIPSQSNTNKNQPWASSRDIVWLVGRQLAMGALILAAIVYLSQFGLAIAAGVDLLAAARLALIESVTYIAGLLRGSLGMTSAATASSQPLPVSNVLPEVMARSLALLSLALALASAVGVALGIWAASGRKETRSLPILLLSIVGVSAPSFFVALILQLLALRWVRITGSSLLPVGGFGWDSHIILPALVLAARPVAQITRVTFIAVGEVFDQDFIRTATSKGLRSHRILGRHVLRNAAVPVLTTIGLSLRFSLSSLPVVELFFGWPGAGFMLLKAIAAGDGDLTNALLISFGIIFVGVNLLLNLLYLLADPRLRDMPGRVRRRERQTWQDRWQALSGWLSALFSLQWLAEWFKTARSRRWIPDQRQISRRQKDKTAETGLADLPSAGRRKMNWNTALVLGGILVLLLLVAYVFGPQISRHSPYTTRGMEFVDGTFRVPPFEPDDVHPWGTDVLGRDMQSLVLAGAQQTLSLAALVVIARMVIGLSLGLLSGWFNGRWIDRMIGAVAEVLAAFPMLVLAMLLILTLGIRGGYRPFLVALSLVGWGELMLFVRGEVLKTRPRPFIESAQAIGAGTPRVVFRHILPNLAPALISLAALEMGAVLMLLGELGFIGIFIGGGAFAELVVDGPKYHYSDVPEWASLLSNVRLYARTYIWTALYPALAFFFTILAFNLLGEGLRRLADAGQLHVERLLNRYTAAFAVFALLAVIWVNNNTGALAFYRAQARMFDGDTAYSHVAALSQPDWQGRSLGTNGPAAAADYIAAEFESLGLQRAGEDGTYFQTQIREYEQLDSVPLLAIDDDGAQPVFREDFTEFAGLFRILGDVEGPVTFLSAGPSSGQRTTYSDQLPREWRDLNVENDVLLVLQPDDVERFTRLPHKATLVVADDPQVLPRRYTLPARSPIYSNYAGRDIGQEAPVFWISEEIANRLLEPSGETIDRLRRISARLPEHDVIKVETGRRVHMAVEGTIHDGIERDGIEVANVLGHLPAVEGQGIGDHMIIVMAQYDAPPLSPDGEFFAGANDNSSGVAIMLEAIRTMEATGYRPYKTFLFVAYSGEGSERGEPIDPRDVRKFLDSRLNIGNHFTVEAIVDLRGLGSGSGLGSDSGLGSGSGNAAAGDGGHLILDAGGSLRLVDLFDTASSRSGLKAERAGELVDISIVFDRSQTLSGGEQAPYVGVHWQGWESTARTAWDGLESVHPSTLDRAGRAITLALMALGRETQY